MFDDELAVQLHSSHREIFQQRTVGNIPLFVERKVIVLFLLLMIVIKILKNSIQNFLCNFIQNLVDFFKNARCISRYLFYNEKLIYRLWWHLFWWCQYLRFLTMIIIIVKTRMVDISMVVTVGIHPFLLIVYLSFEICWYGWRWCLVHLINGYFYLSIQLTSPVTEIISLSFPYSLTNNYISFVF